MIKISHSVFALPFALAAMALAMREEGGWSWRVFSWVVFCAVMARTAAMAQNRLADSKLDAENPRTAGRAIPAKRVSKPFVLGLVVVSSGLFVFGASMLNEACLQMSPVVLFVLLFYPYTKRVSSLCHVWLGIALGLAPLGAWVAVRGWRGGFLTPVVLGVAVTLWTAGFDVIYACQDFEADRKQRLHSIPARFGLSGALRISTLMHVACVALLAWLGWANPHLGWLYGAGVGVGAMVLWQEHKMVAPDDLSRLGVAFLNLNAAFAAVVGGAAFVDALWVVS
ncbi:MAG: UbiA-like polyprenyltransferase [Planctomycetota bacterium]